MKKVYYFESAARTNNWGVTLNEAEAKFHGDEVVRLASINDLEDWVCTVGEWFEEPVIVQEGIYVWSESGEEADYIELAMPIETVVTA